MSIDKIIAVEINGVTWCKAKSAASILGYKDNVKAINTRVEKSHKEYIRD